MKGRYIEGITDMKVDIQKDITDTSKVNKKFTNRIILQKQSNQFRF